MAFGNAHFGAGIGPIHLDNIGCNGSEENLIDCSRSSFVSCYRYGHRNDAGVRCQSMFSLYGMCNIFWSGSVLNIGHLQSMSVATALMVMFVWWEAPISMRVEWRCASMTSGEQCVMTSGTALMRLWSASIWDMHILEVSVLFLLFV